MNGEGLEKSSPVCSTSTWSGQAFYTQLNDVFEAETAVAGQAFAFASPTQVLAVGPLRVNVAEFD